MIFRNLEFRLMELLMGRFSELQVMVAIVDCDSLIGAARRLGRSPPSITRILSELEERVGLKLVERSTRRCQPTDAGRRLADHARHILSGYDDAISEAAGDATEPRGLIRVTAPLVFGRRHVAPSVSRFLDDHRAIAIDLQLADRVIDLHEENFDIGIRIGELADQSLIARRVGEVRRMTVASAEYLEARGIPENPRDLAHHDIVQHTAQGINSPWVYRDVDGAPMIVNLFSRFAVNQAEAAIAAAREGRGIVRALSYQVADELASGDLTRILQEYEPEPMPVHIIWPDSRRPWRRIRLLIEQLAASFAALEVIQRGKGPPE